MQQVLDMIRNQHRRLLQLTFIARRMQVDSFQQSGVESVPNNANIYCVKSTSLGCDPGQQAGFVKRLSAASAGIGRVRLPLDRVLNQPGRNREVIPESSGSMTTAALEQTQMSPGMKRRLTCP